MNRPLLLGGLSVFFVLFLLAGAARAGSNAQYELKAGYAAIKLGDSKTGVAHLNRALKTGRLSRRERILAYSLLGDAHRSLKKFSKALSDYNVAIKIARKSLPPAQKARLHVNRGLIYQRKGKYDKAIKDYNQAIKYNSSYATAYYRRGTAHRLKRQFKKAISDYTMALTFHNHYCYYYHRSQAYTRLGKLKKALNDMKKAVKLNPKSRQYRSRLSYLESLQDR